MSLYSQWEAVIGEMTDEQVPVFQAEYYAKEEALYAAMLEDHTTVIEGTLEQLCERFEFQPVYFAGFMDGINTSLKKAVNLKTLKATSKIKLDVDYEKLYFNMLNAKANWLYQLPQWEGVLSEQRRREIQKEQRLSKQARSEKVDRNAPCPCGSGKKYKKCCGAVS